MSQMTLNMNLGPVVNPIRRFWCCGDCIPLSGGRMSLTWQPPDYMSGECVHCKRTYTFESRYGEDELIAAGGKT